jgi:hypothetical protein
MARHFEAFDKLRTQGFFVGEMIWNFADFKTAQSKYKQIIYFTVWSVFPSVQFKVFTKKSKKKLIIIQTPIKVHSFYLQSHENKQVSIMPCAI